MKVQKRYPHSSFAVTRVASASSNLPTQATNGFILPPNLALSEGSVADSALVYPSSSLDYHNRLNLRSEFYQRIFESITDGILVVDPSTGTVIAANDTACKMHGYQPDEIRQMPLAKLIHPNYLFLFFPETGSSSTFKHVTKINTTHLHHDGSQLFLSSSISRFQDNGSTYLLISLQDIQSVSSPLGFSKVRQFVQKRVDDQIHEQTTLLEISQTLSSTLDLDPELILEQLRKIISFTHAGLFTIQETSLNVLAACGLTLPTHEPPIKINLGGTEILQLFSLTDTRQPEYLIFGVMNQKQFIYEHSSKGNLPFLLMVSNHLCGFL